MSSVVNKVSIYTKKKKNYNHNPWTELADVNEEENWPWQKTQDQPSLLPLHYDLETVSTLQTFSLGIILSVSLPLFCPVLFFVLFVLPLRRSPTRRLRPGNLYNRRKLSQTKMASQKRQINNTRVNALSWPSNLGFVFVMEQPEWPETDLCVSLLAHLSMHAVKRLTSHFWWISPSYSVNMPSE